MEIVEVKRIKSKENSNVKKRKQDDQFKGTLKILEKFGKFFVWFNELSMTLDRRQRSNIDTIQKELIQAHKLIYDGYRFKQKRSLEEAESSLKTVIFYAQSTSFEQNRCKIFSYKQLCFIEKNIIEICIELNSQRKSISS